MTFRNKENLVNLYSKKQHVLPDTAMFPQMTYTDFLDQRPWHIPDQLFYV